MAARNDVLSAPRMLSQVRKVPLAHRYLRMSLSCQGELLVSSVLSVALFLPLLVAAVVGALALFTFRTARRIEAALPPRRTRPLSRLKTLAIGTERDIASIQRLNQGFPASVVVNYQRPY